MDFKKFLAEVIENQKKLDSCTHHRFEKDLTPDKSMGKEWECLNCGGRVNETAKRWYERGLKHFASKAEERIDKIDLSDEKILEQFDLQIDGRSLTKEEIKAIIAYIRSLWQ